MGLNERRTVSQVVFLALWQDLLKSVKPASPECQAAQRHVTLVSALSA